MNKALITRRLNNVKAAPPKSNLDLRFSHFGHATLKSSYEDQTRVFSQALNRLDPAKDSRCWPSTSFVITTNAGRLAILCSKIKGNKPYIAIIANASPGPGTVMKLKAKLRVHVSSGFTLPNTRSNTRDNVAIPAITSQRKGFPGLISRHSKATEVQTTLN
ncbi:hypothetical protein RRG08_035370 [Elysia crispata]|uniref:Uncharacterized protein n=1 Tax=Elysia crispata TaxID=231223 RepID=A0AAE0Y3J4_9GAST|nr:hypothetical protein RRG08_035370 [Elysia crispata]